MRQRQQAGSGGRGAELAGWPVAQQGAGPPCTTPWRRQTLRAASRQPYRGRPRQQRVRAPPPPLHSQRDPVRRDRAGWRSGRLDTRLLSRNARACGAGQPPALSVKHSSLRPSSMGTHLPGRVQPVSPCHRWPGPAAAGGRAGGSALPQACMSGGACIQKRTRPCCACAPCLCVRSSGGVHKQEDVGPPGSGCPPCPEPAAVDKHQAPAHLALSLQQLTSIKPPPTLPCAPSQGQASLKY